MHKREREREGEGKIDRDRERQRDRVSEFVCVCVCVQEIVCKILQFLQVKNAFQIKSEIRSNQNT